MLLELDPRRLIHGWLSVQRVLGRVFHLVWINDAPPSNVKQHHIYESQQIENEKNTWQNPGQMTWFGSAYESVHPGEALHWILQKLLLVRALYIPYFRIKKDILIRTKVLAC